MPPHSKTLPQLRLFVLSCVVVAATGAVISLVQSCIELALKMEFNGQKQKPLLRQYDLLFYHSGHIVWLYLGVMSAPDLGVHVFFRVLRKE